MTLMRPPRLGDRMIFDCHGDTRGLAAAAPGLDIYGLRARLEALGVEYGE